MQNRGEVSIRAIFPSAVEAVPSGAEESSGFLRWFSGVEAFMMLSSRSDRYRIMGEEYVRSLSSANGKG